MLCQFFAHKEIYKMKNTHKTALCGVFGALSSMASADLAFEVVESGSAGQLAIIADEFFGGSALAGFSFLMFNLLCAPCFAAMGAIRREMNNGKWTAFAISYMCVFAYIVCLITYQLGIFFAGAAFTVWTAIAIALVVFMLYMIFRKDPYNNTSK